KSGQRLFEQNAGGAPANVLMTLKKCGMYGAFIGKVGDDMQGHFIKRIFEQAKIDTSGLVMDQEAYTTLSFISQKENGERKISFARKPGADTRLEKKDVKVALLRKCKVLHIGAVSLTEEGAREATLFAIQEVKENGYTISYDPNYRESLWKSKEEAKEVMGSMLPYVDIIKVSKKEAMLITGESRVEQAAVRLKEEGIQVVVITLGENGSYVCNEDGGLYVKGFQAAVVDTTAAGDAFWGAFLSKLLMISKKVQDVSLEELADCALFGNAVASLCVEKFGGIQAIPDFESAKSRYLESVVK
ncbi:MAG: carbohydrate kinase, partial [Eubacteriales bacterium]